MRVDLPDAANESLGVGFPLTRGEGRSSGKKGASNSSAKGFGGIYYRRCVFIVEFVVHSQVSHRAFEARRTQDSACYARAECGRCGVKVIYLKRLPVRLSAARRIEEYSKTTN